MASGHSDDTELHAVVFGSDQGLVGRFNEVVVDRAMVNLGSLPAKAQVWAVGERVQARLLDAGMPPVGSFPAPRSAQRSHDSSGRFGDLLTDLGAHFHRQRRSGIDEELFDVIARIDAMAPAATPSA